MAMAAGNAGGVNSDINVTPMIDVLLVLLIIFMIAQMLNRSVVEITIPPVDTGTRSNAPSNQIVMEIRDDGSYAINGQTPFQVADLDKQIHTLFDARPTKLLFIKPGQNRPYGDIIEAVDISKSAGVEVVGFTPAEAN